jgi:N-acyl amino acid synthase of PEP-CTERM/exosortase system
MQSEEIFNLLTKEYSFVLATSINDIQEITTIRKNIISHHYPELQQTDQYSNYLFNNDDKQSFIYLLRHNISNQYLGSVRVFFINQKTEKKLLPMQYDIQINDINHLTKKLPIVEISRGALVKDLPKHNRFSGLQLRTLLTYGLMVATRINFLLYPCTHVFSIMERPLHRILKRQKVNFIQVGKPVEYYGIRIPYGLERHTLVTDTEKLMGRVTRHYLKELCQNPEPFWEFIDNNPYLERSDIQLERICKLFKEHGDDVDISLLLGEERSKIPTS